MNQLVVDRSVKLRSGGHTVSFFIVGLELREASPQEGFYTVEIDKDYLVGTVFVYVSHSSHSR